MVVNDDHQEGGNAHPHQVEEAQAEGAHRAPPLEDTWTSESPPKKRNRNSATKRSASSKRRKSNHISRTSSVDTVVVSFTEEDGGDEYNTNKARCEREASADGKRSKQHVSSTSSKKQHRNVYVKEKTSDGTAVSTAKVKLQFDPSPPKRSTRNVVAPEAAEGQGGFSSGYDPSISPEKRRKAQGGWVASAKESRWSTRNLLRNMPKSLFGGSSSTQGGRGPTTSCTSTTTQLVNHTEVGPEDEFERFRGMYVMDDSSHDQSKQTTPERPGATKPGGGCSDSASRISTSRESPVPYGVAIGSADTRSAASTTSKTRLKNRSMDDMKELVNHRSRRNNSGSSLSPTKSKLKTSYNGRSAERGSADLHNRSSLKKKKKSSRKKREEAELQKMVSAGPQDVASILKASHLLDEEEEEAGEHSPMKHLYGFREEEGLHFSPRDDGGAEGKGDGLEDDEDSRKDGPIIPAHFQITSECASRRPSALGDMHALSGNYPLLQGRHAITGISGGRVKHMADGQTSKSRLSTHEDAQYLYQTRGEGTMDFLRLEDLPDSPPGNKDSPRGGKGTIALGGAIALPQRRVSARSGVAMQMMGGGGSGKDGAEDKDVDEENSESSEGAEAPTPRLYHKIKCWSRFKRRFENIPMPGEEHGAVVLEGDASFHEALETLKAYSTRDYFQSRHRKLAADATWKRYRDVVAVALILFANLLYIGVDVDDHKPKRRVRILVESQWKDDVDRTIFMHSGLASLHSGMFSASATLRQLLGFPLPKDQREDHDDADFPSTELTINGHRQILGGSSDVAQNGLWALPAYRHRDQMLKKKRAAAYDLILGSRDSSEQARVAHQPGETIWEVVEETTSAARIDNIFSEVEALHEKSLRKRRELLASAFTTSSNGGHHGGATSATSGSGASPGEPDHDVVSSLEQSLEDAFGGQGATLHSRNLRAALNSTASSKRRKLFEHAGSLRILGSSGAPEEDVGDGEASSSFSLSDMQEYNNGDGSFGRTTRKRGPIASTWSSFWSLIFGRQRQHTLIGREEHRRRTYGEYRSEKSLILPDGSRPIQWREAMLHQLRKERAVFSPPPGTGSSLAKNSGVGFGEPVATSSEEESSGVHLSSHNIPAVDHLEDSLVEPPSLLSQLFHDAATFVEQTRSFFSPGPTLVVIAPPADGSAVFLTDHARAYEQKCHVQKHTFERVPVCAKAKHARGRPLMVLLEENKGTNTKSMRGVLKDLDDGALAAEDSKTSTSSTSSAIHEDDVFAQLQGPAIAWRRKLLAQQRRHKRELLAASSASLRSGSSSRSTSESSLRTLSDTLEQDSEDDLLEDQGDFSSSSPPRRILLQVEDRPLGNLVLDLLFFGFFFWELIYRCSRYTYYNLEHFINDNFFPFVCVVLDIARLSVIFTGGTEDKVIHAFLLLRLFRVWRYSQMALAVSPRMRRCGFVLDQFYGLRRPLIFGSVLFVMACYFTSFLITSQVKQAVRDGLYFEYTSKKNPSWSQNDYFKATFYSFFTIVQMTFFDHWLTGIIRPMGEIQNTLAFLLMGVILVIQFGLVNNISGLFVAYVIKNGEQQRDQNRFVKEARRKAQLQLSAFLRMRELLDEHAQPCPYVRRRQMRRFRFRKSTAPDFNIEARGAHGSAMLFTKEDLEDVMRPPEPPLLLDALGKPLPDNLQPKDPEMTWKECQRALGIRADEVLEAYDIIHQADIDTHGFGVTTDAFLGALLVFAGDLKARDVHTLCCTARACIGKLDKLGESFKEANSGCSLIEITTERVHQLLFDMYECRGAPAPGAKGTAPVRYRNYPKPLPDIVEDPRAISSGVRVLDAEIAMKKRKEEAMLAEEAEKLGKSTWHFGMPKGHDYDAYYPERFKGRQEDDSSSSDEE